MTERDYILQALLDADEILHELQDRLGSQRVIAEYCDRARKQIAEAEATRHAELKTKPRVIA